MKTTKKKQPTQSQRLRAVLYIYWKTETDKHVEFEEFYARHMEAIINVFKSKLKPI